MVWLIIISWFVVGFICVAIEWIGDMRGKPFNKHYFNGEVVASSITIILSGYISPIILYSIYTSEKKYFTRFIYWIANIGTKKHI